MSTLLSGARETLRCTARRVAVFQCAALLAVVIGDRAPAVAWYALITQLPGILALHLLPEWVQDLGWVAGPPWGPFLGWTSAGILALTLVNWAVLLIVVGPIAVALRSARSVLGIGHWPSTRLREVSRA